MSSTFSQRLDFSADNAVNKLILSPKKELSPPRKSGIPIRNTLKPSTTLNKKDIVSTEIDSPNEPKSPSSLLFQPVTNQITDKLDLSNDQKQKSEQQQLINNVQAPGSLFDIFDESKVISILMANPSLIKEVHEISGKSVLHHACENNFSQVINYLLKRDIDIDSQDNHGMTPLHYCSNEKLARLLW